MNRRSFLEKVSASGIYLGVLSKGMKSNFQPSTENKLVNAYYFRAHMYTLVPRHVREDLKWMKDIGTDVVSIAVLEQDLFAGERNISIICNEADRLGMKVFAVPSRWGGLVAGAPKVPSLFSVKNPDTWVLNKDGSVKKSNVSGVISSIHHEKTLDFVCDSLEVLFKIGKIAGIVWDEPKTLEPDYSPAAISKLGVTMDSAGQAEANCKFYSTLNRFIKGLKPDAITNLFLYANISDVALESMAKTRHLDYFGCDGRPWYPEDRGKDESTGKTLLGKNAGERFLSAAMKNKVSSLWLIENHNMEMKDLDLFRKRLPEVLQKGVDQLIYYYYPRNLEDPETIMSVIKKGIYQYKLNETAKPR